MIDVLNLRDKNGKKVFNLTTSRDSDRMRSLTSILLKFPSFEILYKQEFDYETGFGDDEDGIDEYHRVADHGTLIVTNGSYDGKAEFGLLSGIFDSKEEVCQRFQGHIVTDQDINRAIRMAFAYQYMTEHVQEKIAGGRTKEELMHLPYMDVVRMGFKKNGMRHDFESEMQACLKHSESTEDRAQELLDKTFGKGTVDLDAYIQEQVEAKLAAQESATEKPSISERIKGGFAKLLTPVRMISQKISDAREFKALTQNEKVGTKWEIEQKAKILEEEFNEI